MCIALSVLMLIIASMARTACSLYNRCHSHNQCLQLKLQTQNVQNQTKNGPNLNEKTD